MERKYIMPHRLSSYEVDPQRNIKPSAILRLIQEVAGRHLESDGLSYEVMRDRGIVFLIIKASTVIIRAPHCDEQITVETWFECTRGAYFIRNVQFCDKNGDVLIKSETDWIIADPESHRVMRPSAYPFEMTPSGFGSVDVKMRRLVIPETSEVAGSREVRWSDTDCNAHMNNAVYADIICDCYPNGLVNKSIKEFQIDYLGEALSGETITVMSAPAENEGILFEGTINGRRCFSAYALCQDCV